jgi:hypothetical protein
MHADAWAALAQWVTSGIAIGAAGFAFQQVKEARQTRESVAQPNVVVFTDRDPIDGDYRDLVIKNFGKTPAYNIKLSISNLDMVPRVSPQTGEKVTTLYVPSKIFVLAPGQEWRSVWDSGRERAKYAYKRENSPYLDLPRLETVFSGEVTFEGTRGKKFKNPVRLDLDIFRNAWGIIGQ